MISQVTGHRKLSRFALQTLWMNAYDYFVGCRLVESHMFMIPLAVNRRPGKYTRMKHQLRENPNNLPSEIVREILSWLPVKSLCRFECVSKPWRSLIADPKFSTMLFNKAIKDKDRLLCQRRSVIVTDVAHNGLTPCTSTSFSIIMIPMIRI